MLLLLAGSTSAEVTHITQTLLLPSGQPAVGAKVEIRTVHDETGALKKELNIVADATGTFSADVDLDRTTHPLQLKGYVIIDAPGTALAFESIDEVQGRSFRHEGLLRLRTGGILSGTVTTSERTPVANATVTLHEFSVGPSYWRLNDAGAGFVTPEMVTKSASDGTWALRPVAIEEQTFGNGQAFLRAELSATAKVKNETWAGSTELVPQEASTPPPARPDPFRQIVLYPTVTVRGQVVNAETGKPIAGAKLKIAAYPDSITVTIPAATSEPAGHFMFANVPAVFELFVTASHPDLSQGWTRITPETPRMVIDGTGPRVYDNVLVTLHSTATISGRIIDTETGQPPSPVGLRSATLYAYYNDSFNDGYIKVGGFGVRANIQPNGIFSLQTALGSNDIQINCFPYGPDWSSLHINVAADGIKNFVIKVHKMPCFYVRFAISSPSRLYETEIHIRKESTNDDFEEGSAEQGIWTKTAQHWGDKLEIRITHGNNQNLQELLPWTEITASPDHWPLIIPIK